MSMLAADRPAAAPANGLMAAAAASERDALRGRFLQLVLAAQQTVLPDNLDPLFHPWGHGSTTARR